ncbi:MAG TPA: sulfite exporter TauE/SafE family protein [Azospira sp.]|nr:sulfite exporter TauE/SafE family protein [Azospira sp.]HNN08903.1 sulfite exporter TauE/SafE family protein [Azospira sp.]
MPDSGFLALFLVGLLGGTHCVGMCGGIVGALSMGGAPRLSLHLAYNAGRITSYAVAGGLVGALGGASLALAGQLPLRIALYLLANLMLIALGLYLMGLTRALAFSERLGQNLWRRIQPSTRRFLPAHSVAQAFPLGLLWGWLPCGLVYSALATSLTAGSAGKGALLMLAFGLGTLPNLLLAGFLLARLRHWVQQPAVRVVAGLLVAAFGVWGMVGVWRLAGQ